MVYILRIILFMVLQLLEKQWLPILLLQREIFKIHILFILEVCELLSCWAIVYSKPHAIYIEEKDSYILKNVFIDCIPIHGDTIFDSFVITPDLPQDLYIDNKRQCIGGVYSGFLYGKQDYYLQGFNEYGTTGTSISLYYTRKLVV